MSDLVKVHHPILRHPYLLREDKNKYSDTKTEYGASITELKHKLDDLTRLEILKLSDDDRPGHYRQFVDRGGVQDKGTSKFNWNHMTVPECWTYFDDDLVKELDRLWEQYGASKFD